MSANTMVTLSFKADSSQAKREIQSLVVELNKLSTNTISSSFTQNISNDVKNAARDIGKFSTLLRDATNVDTGKLDLSKLNQGLKQANTDLPKMANSFKVLGNDGVKAFANVVKQINAAEVPLKKTNAAVDKLWTSFKNTINWQISSSALHGLMSGIQGAVNYAQDLNESLNNIRIVTGYSVDQMAEFAVEANKAAKALSTTTTAYSDAALIYYQQGLSKKEVQERADITIKMANVTRQSATEVSNQLTSIWNNFDDGTQSLEYYADVLTKLGAATASSTDEIAGGLEKFAAVADTIGLSYEYAASALATITSNTRQSEEVVGTALKTIFARIQGLNLGETLDDGTTLNKYSEALDKVGISIFNQSGEIKKMDSILDELGSKWSSISKDQQIALAQTVAGVRQYNQLISLMDNWNSGDADSMMANLSTARGATGELNAQADIYADSWEAAQKRVQASLETLYNTLIDDDFFIDLLDTASGFIDIVNNLIEGLGGVKGLLLTISTYVLKIAHTQISDELKRITGPSVKKQTEEAYQTKMQANKELGDMAMAGSSQESQAIATTYSKIASVQGLMIKNADKLSATQVKLLQGELDQYEVLGKTVSQKAKLVDAAEKELRLMERQQQIQNDLKIQTIESVQGKGNLLNTKSRAFTEQDFAQVNQARAAAGLGELSDDQKKVLSIDANKLSGAAKTSHLEKYKQVIEEINAELEEAKQRLANLSSHTQAYRNESENISKAIGKLYQGSDVKSDQVVQDFRTAFDGLSDNVKQAVLKAEPGFEKLLDDLTTLSSEARASSKVIAKLDEALASAGKTAAAKDFAQASRLDAETVTNMTAAIDAQVDETLELDSARERLAEEGEKVGEIFDEELTKLPDWQDSLVNAATAVTSVASAFSALSGLIDTLKDPNTSGWEKFTTVLTTLATVVPGVIMGIKALREAKVKDTIVNALNTASEKILEKQKKKTADAAKQSAAAQKAETNEQVKDTAVNVAQSATEKGSKAKFGGLKSLFGKGAGAAGTGAAGAGATGAAGAGASGAGGGAAGSTSLTAAGGTLAASIVLIAAGIAVLVGGIAWAIYQANEAERAVEKAKQTASELQQNYETVKASYDEFNNATSAYESAQETVENLTKGTEEYANAVREANDAAMQLLSTNENLKYSIENGQIVIDSDSLEEQQAVERQRLENAQAANLAGQVQLSRAEEDLQKRDMARQLNSSKDNDEHWGNVGGASATGAAAGALIGTAILPGLGSAIGAGIGLLVGAIGGAIATTVTGAADDSESEALEKLEAAYREDNTILQKLKDGTLTDKEWDEIGIDDSALRDSLQENADEVSALVEEMAANTEAINAQNDVVAANALSDNEAVQNSDYQDQIIDIAGDAYGRAYDEALKSDWVETWGKEGIAQIDGANKEAQKVFEEYLKYAGLEGQGYELTDTTGNDNNRKFVYKDSEGNEHTVTLEAMQAARAAYEASNTLDETATKLANKFEELADSTNKADKALLSFLSIKNLENATQEEYDDMVKEIGDTSSAEDVEAYLDDLIGDGKDGQISDANAQSYGYKDADDMVQSLMSDIEDYEEAWEDLGKVQSKTVKKALRDMRDSGDLEELSLAEAEAFGKSLQQAFNTSGKEGIETLEEMLEYAGESSDEFANAISNIDWDTATVHDLEEALDLAGVECTFTTDQLQDLIDVMSDATVTFEKATAVYKALHDIVDELESGDIVSAEDFASLEEQFGSQMNDYFLQMADGTFKLIGDAEEFYNLVNGYTLDNFENSIATLNEENDKITNLLTNSSQEDILGNAFSIDGLSRSQYATRSVFGNDLVIRDMSDPFTTWDDPRISGNANVYNLNGKNNAFNLDENQLQSQYDFLKAIGYSDEDQLAEWREGIENRTLTVEQMLNMQEAVKDNIGSWDQLTEVQQDTIQELNRAKEAIASENDTVGELNDDLATNQIDQEQYDKAYESVRNKEIESYGLAVEDYELIEEAIIGMGEAGEEWYKELERDQEALNEATKDATVRYMRMNDAIEDLYDNYEDYNDVLTDVQSATSDLDKADIMTSKSAKSLQKSLAGLLGTSEDLIDADLLSAIDPEDFKSAAEGDAAAIERIRDAFIDLQAAEYLGEDAIEGLQAELDEFNAGAMLDLDNMPFLNALIQAWVDAGLTADEIESRLSGMNIDADVSPFNEAMAEMVNNADAAGSAVVQSTSIKQTAEVVEEPTPNTQSGFTETITPHFQQDWAAIPTALGMPLIYRTRVPYYTKSISFDSETDDSTTSVVGVTSETGDGKTGDGGVIIQNAHKSSGNRVSTGNSTKPSLGTSSGGSSSKPSVIEKRDTTDKSDVVERYREVNDAIDNVTDALTRAEKATDRLWGRDKLNAMREENKILQQQYDLLQEKAKQAKEYAEEDYANLMNVASEAGISLVVDRETGDIVNIEDEMEKLYEDLAEAEATYNQKVADYNAAVAKAESDGETSDEEKNELESMKDVIDAYEKDTLGTIEDDIEAVQNAEKQFQDSVETWEQMGLDMEDVLDQIMQNNYDIIMEGLQIPLSLNEEDLRYVDLQLSKLEDDVYQMAEALVLTMGKVDEYSDNLRLADEALAQLNEQHQLYIDTNGQAGITDAAYQEGLNEIKDQYYDNIEALMELDKMMETYYSDTLDAANEELSKYTDQMEHQTSVLEHYQSLIELMGKSNDYKMIGEVLEGQVETSRDAMEVSKNWYEARRADADTLAAEYAAAEASGASEAELEIIRNNWQAAEAAANEAQDQMLSDAEAWAEALKAVLENKLADLGQTLENALTGGTSFDTLTTQMERAASLQEEYLTTTNQIYETNKLMRTAQQEIDKTTNSVAKKKLQGFIEETQQLQDQSKLSSYELEIQQAKYDLLLAEIALQEAQDAKSVVRLQRDSEGNFGYVYTADGDKMAEAQQQLEDAQNNLYNIGLEGANDYAQKYQQTMQEMYDTLGEIQSQYLDGAFESEAEYQQAMEEAKEYYYQKLQDYSSLYSVALTTDSRVVADAWSTDFSHMIYDTEKWKDAVETYTNDAIAAFREWQAEVTGPDGVTTIIGSNVSEVGKNVEEVTTKSGDLAEKVTSDVIPALDAEIKSVQGLTGEYANLRDTINEIIEKYSLMISTINGEQQAEWDKGDSTEGGGTSTGEDGTTEDGTSGGDTSGSDGSNGDGTSPDTDPKTETPTLATGSTVQVKTTATHFSRDGGNGTRMKDFVPGSYYDVLEVDDDEVRIGKNKATTGWVYKTDLVGFDTGGYTGDWAGSYGKLAFLHQKEMVLNAKDTENLLMSMELLTQILDAIDLQSASAQIGGILSSPGFMNAGAQTIEQNVHIEASFPGVSDRNELEEAFNNLINRASQYANRK